MFPLAWTNAGIPDVRLSIIKFMINSWQKMIVKSPGLSNHKLINISVLIINGIEVINTMKNVNFELIDAKYKELFLSPLPINFVNLGINACVIVFENIDTKALILPAIDKDEFTEGSKKEFIKIWDPESFDIAEPAPKEIQPV